MTPHVKDIAERIILFIFALTWYLPFLALEALT